MLILFSIGPLTGRSIMTSQVRVFSLLGDSNVKPHVTKTSRRANPQLKNAQILSCGHLGIFRETLAQIKADVTVAIISCMSNFVSSADGPSAVSHRVDPVLQEVQSALHAACVADPSRFFLVSPPMYRTQPIWYREGLPEILNLFSQVLNFIPLYQMLYIVSVLMSLFLVFSDRSG